MKKLNRLKLAVLFIILFVIGTHSINAQCSASFTYIDNGGGNYSFTNTSTGVATGNYFWDFGDGTYSSAENPSHTYLTNGTYYVSFGVSDSLCSDSIWQQIVVNSAAGCHLSASFTYVDNGSGNYSFTNTSTGTYNYSYWGFGDGSGSSVINPSYTYTANGTYSVYLIIGDSINSCMDTIWQQVVVTNVGCNLTVSFTVTDNGNGNYFFTNTSTGGATGNYYWDFGDGNYSSAENPNHTYLTNGTYYVSFGASDSLCSDSTWQQIMVNSAAGCNLSASYTYVDNGNGNISFTNTSTGNRNYSYWTFGDGADTYVENPTHTYAANGTYDVLLYIEDSLCSDSTWQQIVITGVVTTGINNKLQLISELKTYPNPVKENLTIELNLTTKTEVEVVVMDLAGNIVDVITNKEVNVGNNTFQWGTENLSNGVYLLSVRANNSMQVKKIVINR